MKLDVPRMTIAVRLLWPGTGRMAIEEARRLPGRLVVYRESIQPLHYSLDGIDSLCLRSKGKRGSLTPLFEKATMTYFAGRGVDATVDLDLILEASGSIRGPALFHDQFAGLSGFLRRARSSEPYAVYLHETGLGSDSSVRTVSSPLLNVALRGFDRAVLRGAKLVFTNSQRNQQALLQSGISSTVLYPGCNPLPALPESREPLVLATSVWDSTRHMEFYVDLARRTRARIVLAGGWGRPEEMHEFISRHHSEVEVTGPLSEAALDALSRRASAYVRFGFGERGPGQGGIQALSYGIPVITNRGLAMSELIDDGEDGYVVESASEAADRVNALLQDSAAQRRMSQQAWEKSKSLSWEAHADRLRERMVDAFSG
jgi:glycosyltransferase involved in cell wall biosynthesis